MSLKILKFQKLSKEELKTINAGAAPDCEPGEVPVQNGIEWICTPIGNSPFESCSWGLSNYDDNGDQNTGDNSGHGW